MKSYQPDKLQAVYRKFLNLKYLLTDRGRLFDHYVNGENLKQLTKDQKIEAKEYWKTLLGVNIDTRWHQLFYSKTGVFTPRYMPFEIYNDLISRQIPSNKVKSFFDDKSLYRYFLRDFNFPHRVAECCNGVCYLPEEDIVEVPFSKVVERCSNLRNCIIKPSKGSSAGIGVRLMNTHKGRIESTNVSVYDLFLSYKGNFVVEQQIDELDCLSRLNPSSCNTLRIHTWRNSHKERCEYISSYVRIGRYGEYKDNASSGGIACKIMPDGKLDSSPCSVDPYKFIEKTDAGVELPGYLIEGFQEMVATAVRAHSCLPLFGIVGWDICMNKDGQVVIIEFNPDPDMRIEQLVFHDTCLLDKQDEIMLEVLG